MSLSWILTAVLLSTAGSTAEPSRGHSPVPEAPRSFTAFADGADVVVRWSGAAGADAYLGEVDGDVGFRSPSRFSVHDDGQITFERRLRDLPAGTHYVRLRAVESFLILSRSSAWTHVERVVVPGVSFGRPPASGDPWGRDGWRVPRTGVPGSLEARASGRDLLVTWRDVPGAARYVLQLDRDRAFRWPLAFDVDPRERGGAQALVVRDVPRGLWYLRVRVLDAFVASRGFGWSGVRAVRIGAAAPGASRGVGFRDGRPEPRDDGRREDWRGDTGAGGGHPVFDEHPGRGKGHLKHGGDPDARSRGRGRDEEEDDDDD